ncbi:Nramp family divalent metal transporter [Patescibacteria group bacterium]|nr:Nramp family divalent metal transporter [Patescibacteria group bacterium]
METKELPKAPSFLKTIGPSFIFLGLSLGSGELILWPYLAANYGLGILWGALLGITFQFIMNMEIERYALIHGESVFVGFWKLWRYWTIWFIFSTFIAWGLPGFSAAGSQLLNQIFGLGNQTAVAVALLLLTGLILSIGKTLYRTMEVLQKSIIIFGTIFISLLVFLLTKITDWQAASLGLIGRGDGYNFLPAGISFMSFLGAFAYAGAGGNLNLAQSYYVKEKGYGMGKYAQKIKSLFSKGDKDVNLEGVTFENNKINRFEFKKWWKVINLEHFFVFWLLGFLTIVLLSVLSFSLVHGETGVNEGINFLFMEGRIIGQKIAPAFGFVFLLLGFLMLYSTQAGVLESTSRIISENFFLLFKGKGGQLKANLSKGFYLALWGQIIFGITVLLLGFKEPRFLLTLAAVINAFCMFVHLGLTYFLNKKTLPVELRPALWRKAILLIAFIFFGVFSYLTLQQGLK